MLNYLKQNTLALLGTMALAFGATQTADAQVIWGAGSTNARIDSIGKFAATDTAFAPLGWTTTTRMANPNFGLWKWYGAPVGSRTFGGTMTSPSAANGAAIFDSDYYFNLSAASAPQNGHVISPLIDLTGHTNGSLTCKFYTHMEQYLVDSMHFGFSKDGGMTWTEVDIRPGVNMPLGLAGRNQSYEGWAIVQLAPFLAGATDLDSCKIRFNFQGDSYWWAVDDVSIAPVERYDIEIVTQSTGNTLGDGFSVYIPGNNVTQPLSQVTNTAPVGKPNEWGAFGARLRNKGAATIVGATHNTKLFLKIEKSAGAGVWNFKMLDSISIDTLKPDSFKIVVDTFDSNWRPDSVGVYRYTYYVGFDTVQATAANDTVRGLFEITSNIYSKVPRANDGFPIVSSATAPAAATGNTVSEFEWGSMYYFPRGASMKLDSVRTRMFADTAVSGLNNATVSVKVYKYRDANASGGLDDQPTAAELNLAAISTDTIPFLPLGFKKITAKPVDFNSASGSDPLLLNDTTIYFITVAQANANGLFPASGGTRGFYMGFYENASVNFSMSSAYCDNNILFSNSAVKTGEIGTAPATDWNRVGFGQDQIPAIALYVSPITVAVQEVSNEASANVNIYPNPAKTVLNVKVEMDAASDLRYIMTDASGRVVRMNTSKNIQTETVSFDVEQLSAGVYFISVLTNKGVSTHRFVKE